VADLSLDKAIAGSIAGTTLGSMRAIL